MNADCSTCSGTGRIKTFYAWGGEGIVHQGEGMSLCPDCADANRLSGLKSLRVAETTVESLVQEFGIPKHLVIAASDGIRRHTKSDGAETIL